MQVLAPLGLVTQKLKTPKWVCRSPLAHFEAASLSCRPASRPAGRKNAEKSMFFGLLGPQVDRKRKQNLDTDVLPDLGVHLLEVAKPGLARNHSLPEAARTRSLSWT